MLNLNMKEASSVENTCRIPPVLAEFVTHSESQEGEGKEFKNQSGVRQSATGWLDVFCKEQQKEFLLQCQQ